MVGCSRSHSKLEKRFTQWWRSTPNGSEPTDLHNDDDGPLCPLNKIYLFTRRFPMQRHYPLLFVSPQIHSEFAKVLGNHMIPIIFLTTQLGHVKVPLMRHKVEHWESLEPAQFIAKRETYTRMANDSRHRKLRIVVEQNHYIAVAARGMAGQVAQQFHYDCLILALRRFASVDRASSDVGSFLTNETRAMLSNVTNLEVILLPRQPIKELVCSPVGTAYTSHPEKRFPLIGRL